MWWKGVAITTVMTYSIVILLVSFHGYYSKPRGSQFCHVTDFSVTRGEDFQPVPNATEAASVSRYMASGQPFLVSGVSEGWPATRRWSHSYFQRVFRGHDLFSSTFSTAERPGFMDGYPRHDVYYGIFLNDPSLASLVANDYQYPQFIPEVLRLQGNEWVHWGHPPCGAKRHMDLTCTGRISVQVAGRKRWRLYPLVEADLLHVAGLDHWNKVLHPLEVTLGPGDALVWFPGWEHETGIKTGPSISLSLHFLPQPASLYLHTFRDMLSDRVSNTCDWGHINNMTDLESMF